MACTLHSLLAYLTQRHLQDMQLKGQQLFIWVEGHSRNSHGLPCLSQPVANTGPPRQRVLLVASCTPLKRIVVARHLGRMLLEAEAEA